MPEATSKPMPAIVVYLVFAALIVAIVFFIVAGYKTYKKDMYIATTPIAIRAGNLEDLEPTPHAGRFPGKDVAQKQLDTRQERVTGKAVEAPKEDPNKKPAKAPKPDDKKKSDKDPNDMLCRIRFPRGYDSPTYLTPALEKEIYVVHQFDVVSPIDPGKQPTRRISVAQIDREPLQFTAFARSIRLGALHDFKHAKMIEEGPVVLPGAAQYAHVVAEE